MTLTAGVASQKASRATITHGNWHVNRQYSSHSLCTGDCLWV